jgi:hypothetical protein
MLGTTSPVLQDDSLLQVPQASPPPLRIPPCYGSSSQGQEGVGEGLNSEGLPSVSKEDTAVETEEEPEEPESHQVTSPGSIPEVLELCYLSDVGSEEVRATSSRVEEGTPEVLVIETRAEDIATSEVVASEVIVIDADSSDSTVEAIRRAYGDDFPGYLWTPNTGFSNISIQQRDGMFADAKYVHFAIENQEPYIYGCDGVGMAEYKQKLYTSADHNLYAHNPDETQLDDFLDESYFQHASLRGVELLEDMGVHADVYCYRKYDRQKKEIRKEKRAWERLEWELTEKYRLIREKEDRAEQEKKLAGEQLARARVRAQIYERLTHSARQEPQLSATEGPSWIHAFQTSIISRDLLRPVVRKGQTLAVRCSGAQACSTFGGWSPYSVVRAWIVVQDLI